MKSSVVYIPMVEQGVDVFDWTEDLIERYRRVTRMSRADVMDIVKAGLLPDEPTIAKMEREWA